jgi:hypothetical protein
MLIHDVTRFDIHQAEMMCSIQLGFMIYLLHLIVVPPTMSFPPLCNSSYVLSHLRWPYFTFGICETVCEALLAHSNTLHVCILLINLQLYTPSILYPDSSRENYNKSEIIQQCNVGEICLSVCCDLTLDRKHINLRLTKELIIMIHRLTCPQNAP